MNKIVITYSNPDIDGVCAAIAYAQSYDNSRAIFFGEIDEAAKQVLIRENFDISDFFMQIPSDYDEIVIVDTHDLINLPRIDHRKVVEIYDHHPTGNKEIFQNAVIVNEKVGSVCTLITEKMIFEQKTISIIVSRLLSYAIISNTLNFKALSTTDRDKNALRYLNSISEVSDTDIQMMFDSRWTTFLENPFTTMKNNTKSYIFENLKVGLVQLELTNIEDKLNSVDFVKIIDTLKTDMNIDICVVNAIDIAKDYSAVVTFDKLAQSILKRELNFKFNKNIALLHRIILRKTDLVPSFMKFYNIKHDFNE
jgi:manganese-dependent inorganic pyrophosphatase